MNDRLWTSLYIDGRLRLVSCKPIWLYRGNECIGEFVLSAACIGLGYSEADRQGCGLLGLLCAASPCVMTFLNVLYC